MSSDLQRIYERRFVEETQFRNNMYKVLCQDYFQKYIPAESTVAEIAAGYCEFINNIQAKKKIAIDLNPDIRQYAHPDVNIEICRSTNLQHIPDTSVDVVFVSNFFEHITRDDIVKTIQEIWRVLKAGGTILVLQPNIRYCAKDYWMFFDHITPLDDRSVCEVLEVSGFKVVECRAKFLPYTTKSALPKSILLLRLYLKLRIAQRIFGQQAFVCARKCAAR